MRCNVTDSPRCTVPADHVVLHKRRDCETSSSIVIGLARGGRVGPSSGDGSPPPVPVPVPGPVPAPVTLGGSGLLRCGKREGEEVERSVCAVAPEELVKAAEGVSRTRASRESRIAVASGGEERRAERRAWNK